MALFKKIMLIIAMIATYGIIATTGLRIERWHFEKNYDRIGYRKIRYNAHRNDHYFAVYAAGNNQEYYGVYTLDELGQLESEKHRFTYIVPNELRSWLFDEKVEILKSFPDGRQYVRTFTYFASGKWVTCWYIASASSVKPYYYSVYEHGKLNTLWEGFSLLLTGIFWETGVRLYRISLKRRKRRAAEIARTIEQS